MGEAKLEVRKGEAQIKKEYLRKLVITHPKETELKLDDGETEGERVDGEPGKKKKRGMNKAREATHSHDAVRLCRDFLLDGSCEFGEHCRRSHDVAAYMATRQPDLGDVCYNYATFGFCKYGLLCRFGNSHVTDENKNMPPKFGFVKETVINNLPKSLQKSLRAKNFSFPKYEEFMKQQNPKEGKLKGPISNCAVTDHESVHAKDTIVMEGSLPHSIEDDQVVTKLSVSLNEKCVENEVIKNELASTNEENVIRLTKREKKTLEFKGKSYLAPLTTVGNLPFRRICKEFGVDITCGEMAVATNLLNGQLQEWALLRRHESEDLFGVQLAGSNVQVMTKTAELINANCTVDFVDINCGCPIDIMYKNGCGSAMMDRVNRLEEVYKGMDYVLDCPVTIKIRTGVQDGKPTTHKTIPRFKEWGVPLLSLHGRSRQQRYTKLADWDYIKQCALGAGDEMALFGNGDILSYQEYYERLEQSNVSGVMIGRGALIKPWIFTEIKERRIWDISSHERFEMLKKYANYGLEHWGSDTLGVNSTRRFLCEWLSFLYRYIPVGLMEVLPQRMNDRPPEFYGRNDLETLMGSNDSRDWVKLTEMILGPSPSDFKFEPK